MKTYKIKTETNGEKVKYYLRADSKYDAYRKAYEKELWIWEKSYWQSWSVMLIYRYKQENKIKQTRMMIKHGKS